MNQPVLIMHRFLNISLELAKKPCSTVFGYEPLPAKPIASAWTKGPNSSSFELPRNPSSFTDLTDNNWTKTNAIARNVSAPVLNTDFRYDEIGND